MPQRTRSSRGHAPLLALGAQLLDPPRPECAAHRRGAVAVSIGATCCSSSLVFLAALFLRTYRLEVPYGMHFDEVYHARTAMEFLQDWRYGMPHSIYEYTHPHLAKYGMAVGIEALGNNKVTSTAQLASSVTTDATIEQRWSPTDQADAHYGDRLYVATGSSRRCLRPDPARVEPGGLDPRRVRRRGGRSSQPHPVRRYGTTARSPAAHVGLRCMLEPDS